MADPIPMHRTIPPPPPAAMRNDADISHDAATQRLSAGLRLFVGRGKPFSVDMLADATGGSASAVEKYMAAQATPGLAMALRLLAALPESFANHLLELSGLTGARRIDATAKSAGVVLAEGAGFVADLAEKLKDGRLDHRERAELRNALGPFIADLQNLQAQLGRESA